MGMLAGFLTMVGNIAGAVASVYLLSMGLEKREFMGTGAWYYLIGNTVKVPFSLALGLITARRSSSTSKPRPSSWSERSWGFSRSA